MVNKSNQASTIHRQQRMLKALSASFGIVTRAAKAAGITPQTHYNWYRENSDYADQVNRIKIDCHEDFKDLVMDAVIKKIQQGNTAIIALCFKTICLKDSENLDSLNPYKPKFKMLIKVAPHPSDFFSKDPMTKLAVKRYMEDKEKQGKLGEIRQDLVRKYQEWKIGEGQKT